MNRTIAALMFCLFSIGSAEFVIAGLLPGIASDLDISVSTAGLLVSAYAIAIVVTGPIMTILTNRVPRKPLMIALMITFAAANVIGAVAPSYAVLMISRVLSALTHCTFFALAIVVGTATVKESKQGAAIARLAIGLNLANVLGVPLGAVVGSQFGWRATLWTIAVLGVLGVLLVVTLVPRVNDDRPSGLAAEVRALTRSQVIAAIGMSALGSGGVFAAYTYIAPMLETVSGFQASAVGPLLLVFGIGTFTGSLIGGRMSDRSLMPSLSVLLGSVVVALVLLALLLPFMWPAVLGMLIFGMSFGAILPGLQSRIMRTSGIGAPTLALSVNIAAMNIGIAFGSWMGGQVLNAGLGLTAIVFAGAVLAALGFILSLVEVGRDRRLNRATTL